MENKVKIVITLILFIALAEFVLFTEPAITAESPLLSDSITKSDNSNKEVNLEDLVQETLSNNPEIKAAQARWIGSTKRPSQEGSLPNPVIGGRFSNVSFDEITFGEDTHSNFQIFISQEIPFPGKLSLKEKVAKEQAESLKWMADATSRKVVAELKEAYYEWFLINKSIKITEENKNLLQKFVKIAEVKYEVGTGIQQDVLKAQVELSGFIERLELLNKKNEIARTKINTILNRPPNSDLDNPVSELKQSELYFTDYDINQLVGEKSPELNAISEFVDSSEKTLNLAKKQYYPDFIVETVYSNRGEIDDIWQLGLGLKIPLYFWKKEKFGVDESTLQLQEAKYNYESTRNNLLFKANEYYLNAKTSDKLIDLYKKGIVPQSKLSLESAISSYQVGDVDFLTLLNNLVALFSFEIEYYRHLTDYQISIAKLEEILGLSISDKPINKSETTNVDETKSQEIK